MTHWPRRIRGVVGMGFVWAVGGALARLDTLPSLIANLERAATVVGNGGVRLDRDTLAALTRRGGFGWGALVLAAFLGALLALAFK